MFFSLGNNPFKDLVFNARKIHRSNVANKSELYSKLFSLVKHNLQETNKHLLENPAFNSRFVQWNQIDVNTPVVRVHTNKNPWAVFKREYMLALKGKDTEVAISKALGWFFSNSYRDDWLETSVKR